nr:hypothetical protein [uncultured Amphritea sp.]
MRNAQRFVTDPWMVEISGAVVKPKCYPLEEILASSALYDRYTGYVMLKFSLW